MDRWYTEKRNGGYMLMHKLPDRDKPIEAAFYDTENHSVETLNHACDVAQLTWFLTNPYTFEKDVKVHHIEVTGSNVSNWEVVLSALRKPGFLKLSKRYPAYVEVIGQPRVSLQSLEEVQVFTKTLETEIASFKNRMSHE